jgi:hypothetical protein
VKLRLAILVAGPLAWACGGVEFSNAPEDLLDPPPLLDAAPPPRPEASVPDGVATDEGGSTDAAGDSQEASSPLDAGDAGPAPEAGYCGAPFSCGDGGDIATPPQVCAHYTGTSEYTNYGAGPGCGTCATNTCACIEAAWTTTNQACEILSCDDSNGEVRVTCR